MSSKTFRWSVLALLVAAVAGWFGLGPPSWTRVTVARVEQGDLVARFTATGEVRARFFTLYAPGSGRVGEATARTGEAVKAGQVLAVVDDDGAWKRLSDAQADFWTAQSALKQATLRWKEHPGAAAAEEMEGARKVVTVRAQDLERARGRVQAGTLRSPAHGTVMQAFAASGDWVSAGQPVVKIQESGRTWVEALVPEADAGFVSPGMKVEVQGGGQTFAGLAARVAPGLEDPAELPGNARFLRVEVELAAGSPRPGTTVEVSGSATVARGVASLPREAVLRDAAGDYCWAVQGRRVQRAAVRPGVTTADRIALVEGPAPGTLVVLAATAKLHPNESVSW